MAQKLLRLIDGPPASRTFEAKACLSWCGDGGSASPARCAAAATRPLTASSRIGAPTGSRNRFTSAKSPDAARGTRIRSNSYASNA